MTPKTRRLSIPIGERVDGGDLALDVSAFHRGAYLVGSSGSGKSETVIKLAEAVTRGGAPAIILDDAGRTFAEMERSVAHLAAELRAAMPEEWSEETKFRVVKQKILDRFAFAFVGDTRPNHHGIDLLKPRTMPTGETESVAQVTIGLVKGYEAIFYKDIGERQTFLQNLEYIGCALCAGGRPISEASTLLLDPAYWTFLVREIDRLGRAREERNRVYVEERLARLRQLLDLRMTKRGSMLEIGPPYPRPFDDQFGSTLRALRPLERGYSIATFFEADTFSPERVAYRDGVFVLTNDISDDLYRSTLNLLVYTFWERLLRYRMPEGGGA